MPSNLLTPFLELDDEFCKSFQSLEVQDGSRRAVGFQRRHSLCPVTLPNSKFNIGGGSGDVTDDLWSITSITNQLWSREQLPLSALQRIPFRADRSISMIEGHVSESPLPPPPGLSLVPSSPTAVTPVSVSVSTVSARYKTELCRTYEESGACKYGAKCQFAHGAEELRGLSRHPKYKTEPCRTFHTVGFCPYGARCHFIHNADEQQQQRQTTRERPRLLRQSVSFAGFSSRPAVPAFQALPDPLAFSRAASVSPPPSSSASCSPDLPSPPLFSEPGVLNPGFGFSADLSALAFAGRQAALQRSSSADSLSDHDGYSSSGSLSGCDSPEVEGSRRLPIFSRLSVSDD